MQIKEENGQIKLIRYVYMPERKRTVNRQIGKFGSYLDEVPSEIMELLDDDEKVEIADFMREKLERQAEFRKRLAVSRLPEALNNAVEALQDGQGAALLASSNYINQLLDGLDELKKELRKQGIKITRGPKSKRKAAEDQPDLL